MTERPAFLSCHRFRLAAGWLLIGLVTTAHAQLPLPKLTSVFPAGQRIGTTHEVLVTGTDLDEASRLVFSDPRLTGRPKAGRTDAFEVTVPGEVQPGLVELRVAGRFGVSNARFFALGGQPEVLVPTTNTAAAAAFDLALDTACHGRVQAGQNHWFRFQPGASRRVLVRVLGRELDSRLVPDLAVLDAQGAELAVARRSQLLDFTAPGDGPYLLRLGDQTFRGGDDFVYRLTLDTGPMVEFAMPPVLRAGATNRIALFGRNLSGGAASTIVGTDGRALDRLEVTVVAPARADAASVRLPPGRRPAAAVLSGAGVVLPVGPEAGPKTDLWFGLTTNPVHVAAEPGRAGTSTNATVVAVTTPVDFGGFFPARGGLSGVRFEAAKGEVLGIEVFAERLGFPTDARVLVQRVTRTDKGAESVSDVLELNDSDANPGGREFDVSTRDVAGRFQAPEDGTYRVLVQNLFRSGPPERRLPYWLSLRRETRDFRLAAFPQPQPRLNDADRQVHLWTTVLRRGESQPVRVIALRRDGFDGDIELLATNLPPGVTAAPGRIPAGQNATSLLLTAAPDAAAGDAAITILGRARIGEVDVTEVAAAGGASWQIADWDLERGSGRPAMSLRVSVCGVETSPVTLAPTEARVFEIASGAKLSVPLQVRRSELFPAAFNVRTWGHPEAEKRKEFSIAEKATNAVLELDLAEQRLPPGLHTLWLGGLIPGKYRNNPEALAAAEAALKSATEAVNSASTDAKPAAEERRKAAEAARKTAEERARPRDLTTAVYSAPLVVKVLPPAPEAKK